MNNGMYQPTRTMTRTPTLLFILLSLRFTGSLGFVGQSPAFSRGLQVAPPARTSLAAGMNEGIALESAFTQITTVPVPSPSLLTWEPSDEVASLDPFLEAELFAGLAHVALDFTGFLSPSKSLIRLFSVVGRVFAISADYLPDHSIHTEELVIQVFLIGIAMKDLVYDKLHSRQQNVTV
jgi:hypothetical protein